MVAVTELFLVRPPCRKSRFHRSQMKRASCASCSIPLFQLCHTYASTAGMYSTMFAHTVSDVVSQARVIPTRGSRTHLVLPTRQRQPRITAICVAAHSVLTVSSRGTASSRWARTHIAATYASPTCSASSVLTLAETSIIVHVIQTRKCSTLVENVASGSADSAHIIRSSVSSESAFGRRPTASFVCVSCSADASFAMLLSNISHETDSSSTLSSVHFEV